MTDYGMPYHEYTPHLLLRTADAFDGREEEEEKDREAQVKDGRRSCGSHEVIGYLHLF